MNIGHITYRYKPLVGGQEVYVDSLVKIFNEKGHKQNVYQREGGEVGEFLTEVPRISDKLPLLLSFNLGLLAKRTLLREEDLLVVNYPEAFPAVAWHRNTLVVSHGSTWTRLSSFRSNKIRKVLARFAFSRAKQFVANDSFVLRELGLDVKPKERMFEKLSRGKWFIPNCVDEDRFQKRKGLKELKERSAILVPRNLTYSRGADLAISAFASFIHKHPKANLVIVGDAIPGVSESLKFKREVLSLVKDLELESKVVFWGSIPWDQMPDVYSSALITIIPTRCSEGTSLSALESMACGTPVISTDVEGLLDLPTFQCKVDAEAIAEAMERVWEKREEIARAQRREVILHYNLNNWKRAWLKVIEDSN